MTLRVNHPLFSKVMAKLEGKLPVLLVCFMLVMFSIPSTVYAQNPLIADTTTPAAPTGNSILKMQFNKASDFERSKDYKKAIEAYTVCINNAPPNSDALKISLRQRAGCYFKTKDYDLCLHDAKLVPGINIQSIFLVSTNDAIRLTPQYNHDALILSGLSRMLTKGPIDESCQDFKTASNIETSPKYKGEKIANTYIKKYCH